MIQLFSGQMNASMEVGLKLERDVVPNSTEEDYLAVTINLKRSDIGRLMINDVVLDVTDINNPGNNRQLIRDSKVITERGVCQDQSTTCQTNGVYLPPDDATQFAYLVKVKHGVPILVDSTILASRTGQFWAKPQWRTSAVSLPIVRLGSNHLVGK